MRMIVDLGTGKTTYEEGFVAPDLRPPLTVEACQRAIEEHIEATARARGYASAVSCASYAVSTNPTWASEAQAFVAWRDAVWAAAFSQLAEWQNGGPAPTIAGVIAALPNMVWS